MEIVNADTENMYNYVNNYLLNPYVFIIVILITVGLFVYLGNTNNSIVNNNSNETNMRVIIIIAISLLLIIILIKIFPLLFSLNISAYINDIFTNNPKINVVANEITQDININGSLPLPEPIDADIEFKKQVFNIPGNFYTYDDASAVCQAFGGKLATYNQIEDAYKNGAEWCNYGWSADQMAYFPTQLNTYDNLKKIKGHEHDCGRPGINGGYMEDTNLKFGVNCYGNKPNIKRKEEELMETVSPYPETKEEIEFRNKVNFLKGKVDQILVSPFNYTSWSS